MLRFVRSCAALAAAAVLLGPLPAAAQGVLAADPLSSPGVLVDASAAPPPGVTATSWIVVDLADGDVLAAQNARAALAPASTLKLLTALALTPGLPDDAVWTGSYDAAAIDGSRVGTVTGSTYTVADLLHGLLLGSGNDCAQGLAELAGGMPTALDEMISTAAGLGATDTVVAGTSGLDAAGQVSSARDLALFGRAVLADPRLSAVVATPRYSFPGAGTTSGPERPRFEVDNHNRLLGRYPGALGLKNGYTVAARGSFVAAAERHGRRYLVAVLQAEGSTWQLAASLLDWAFAAPPDLPAVGSIDGPVEPVSDEAPSRAPADAAHAGAAPATPFTDAVPAATATTTAGPSPVVVALLVVAALALTVVVLRTRVLVRRRRRQPHARRH